MNFANDPKLLRASVEGVVSTKCEENLPFTTANISHPFIQEDGNVRHPQVKAVIDDIWANGDMVGDVGQVYETPYTRTLISVANGQHKAWLYHHPDYNPDEFTDRDLVLSRQKTSKRLLDLDADDSDPFDADDEGAVNDPDVHLQCQCQLQNSEDVLNIPRAVIKEAGWNAGEIVSVLPDTAGTVTLRRRSDGKQIVDKEGRIRLHGDLSFLPKIVNVLLVKDSGECYIRVSK